MKNKNIGHIILKGGTIEDIQKEVSNFPLQPTIEYFIELGYAESTAKQYLRYLRKNAKHDVEKNLSTENSAYVPKTVSQPSNTVETDASIIKSSYANCDNLLVDTCALAYKECLDLIEDAKQVTFIYSTLEEMDKKSTLKGQKKLSSCQKQLLAKNIREYNSKILLFPDKFMLSRFSGYDNETYVDNILLQYLSILPKQIRPTLLTADKNLAAKARSFDFDYIVRCENGPIKTLGYGIKLYENEDGLYIYYKGTHCLEIIHDGKIIPYTKGSKFNVVHGDSICLYLKHNENILEYRAQI